MFGAEFVFFAPAIEIKSERIRTEKRKSADSEKHKERVCLLTKGGLIRVRSPELPIKVKLQLAWIRLCNRHISCGRLTVLLPQKE